MVVLHALLAALNRALEGAGRPGRRAWPGMGASSLFVSWGANIDVSGVENVKWSVCGRVSGLGEGREE